MLQRPVDRWGWDSRLEALTKEAVDLSRGELIDISIDWFGTDELLDYIVRRSSKLKRLCLSVGPELTYPKAFATLIALDTDHFVFRKRLPSSTFCEKLRACLVLISFGDL
ncbi:hypothetical protein L1887_37823 [Cichorium endivia]|nr:hypothetical protein L1887_37823 [Cichorium endivia]